MVPSARRPGSNVLEHRPERSVGWIVAFHVRASARELIVDLRGLDRVLCWRRTVRVPIASISSVRHIARDEVEPSLSHRLYGVGSHRGDRTPGRRRVGAFMGPETAVGRQFWAVEQGHGLVMLIDSDGSEWQRLVVDRAHCTDDVVRMAE